MTHCSITCTSLWLPNCFLLIRRNVAPEDWHPALHPGSLKVTKSSSFDRRTQVSKGTATTPWTWGSPAQSQPSLFSCIRGSTHMIDGVTEQAGSRFLHQVKALVKGKLIWFYDLLSCLNYFVIRLVKKIFSTVVVQAIAQCFLLDLYVNTLIPEPHCFVCFNTDAYMHGSCTHMHIYMHISFQNTGACHILFIDMLK